MPRKKRFRSLGKTSKRSKIVQPRILAFSSYAFEYDQANRITKQTTAYDAAFAALFGTAASKTEDFEFDLAGQLTNDGSDTFAYDDNGNREDVGVIKIGEYNRLDEDANYDYTYDKEGNLIFRRSKQNTSFYTDYILDNRNRLIEVVNSRIVGLPGANKIYFRYNADDQLVSRQIDYHFAGVNGAVTSSNTEYYVYNGSERVLAFDDSDDLKNRTTWGPGVDQLLVDEVFGANNQLDKTLWAAGERLGSVNQLLDNTGAIVEHREYDSFGNIDQFFNATGTEVGPSAMQSDTAFAGRTWDNDAELYYNRARWYEPKSGRFIGEDPAEDGTNWYAYAGNDPLNFRDPTGFAAAGYPLDAFAGGRSGGTVTAAPTISSGATPSRLLNFGSPSAFSPTSSPFLSSAINTLSPIGSFTTAAPSFNSSVTSQFLGLGSNTTTSTGFGIMARSEKNVPLVT